MHSNAPANYPTDIFDCFGSFDEDVFFQNCFLLLKGVAS
jgi:hypothetical protein